MKTNFSLLFCIKKQKNYKTGPGAIYLRLTVDGKRAEIATGRECDPARWNSKAGRASGTKEDIRSLNAFLDNLQSKTYEAHRALCEKNEVITAVYQPLFNWTDFVERFERFWLVGLQR